jgi:hypothetical protein
MGYVYREHRRFQWVSPLPLPEKIPKAYTLFFSIASDGWIHSGRRAMMWGRATSDLSALQILFE